MSKWCLINCIQDLDNFGSRESSSEFTLLRWAIWRTLAVEKVSAGWHSWHDGPSLRAVRPRIRVQTRGILWSTRIFCKIRKRRGCLALVGQNQKRSWPTQAIRFQCRVKKFEMRKHFGWIEKGSKKFKLSSKIILSNVFASSFITQSECHNPQYTTMTACPIHRDVKLLVHYKNVKLLKMFIDPTAGHHSILRKCFKMSC